MEDNNQNQTPQPDHNTNAGSEPAQSPASGTRRGSSRGRRSRGGHSDMQTVDKKGDKKLAYSSDNAPQGSGPAQGRGRGQGGKRSLGPKPEGEASGLVESVIRISRVAKVTKGGTKLSFSALVVVGDGKGNVGYALGKAGEVAVGIKKGLNAARKRMIEVPRRGTTIPHQVIGKWCATEVLLKPASDGTGVIASGAVRAICDGAGIKNILTKVHRSSNPLNVVKATFEGLARLKKVRVNAENAAPVPESVPETANNKVE